MSAKSASQKYALNATWILIEKMSRIISGLLVGILVARYLGPEQFGMISYALNIVAIFTLFSTLGLDTIVVREILVRKENSQTILGTAFVLKLSGSLITVLASAGYSFLHDGADRTLIVLLVSASVLLQSFTVIDFYFQSTVQGRLTAMTQVITLLISSVVKIFMIYLNASLLYFASMVLFEASVAAVCQYLFYRHQGQRMMEWKFSSSEAAELLRHSWPLFLSGLVIVVYQKMDQLFIEGMLNLNLLGNYAAAARISEASNFIPVAICAAIFPGIVHNRDNKILQEKRLIQLYSVMVWSALLISMAGFLVGDEIISFLYKEQYNLAPGLFRILVWNTLVVFFGTAWSIWMVAERKQMYIIISQAVSMSVAFILNLNLIPLYGVSAAAYILVGCQVLNLLIMLTIYKPLATWSQFLSAFRIRNLLDVLKYLRSG